MTERIPPGGTQMFNIQFSIVNSGFAGLGNRELHKILAVVLKHGPLPPVSIPGFDLTFA